MTPQQMRAQAMALRSQFNPQQIQAQARQMRNNYQAIDPAQAQAVRNQMMRQAQAQRNQLMSQRNQAGVGAPSQAMRNQMVLQAQQLRGGLNNQNLPTRDSPANAPSLDEAPFLGKRWYKEGETPSINQYYTPADRQRLGAVFDATYGTSRPRPDLDSVSSAIRGTGFRSQRAKDAANLIVAQRALERRAIGYGAGRVRAANDPKNYSSFEDIRQAIVNPQEYRRRRGYESYKYKFQELSRPKRLDKDDRRLKQRYQKEGFLPYDRWLEIYG